MTVRVVITTYCPSDGHPRGEYLASVLNSLRRRLESSEPIRYVIANDGNPCDPHIECCPTAKYEDVTVVGGGRVGIGGSLNRAIGSTVLPDDLWLYTTDDWLLIDRLDLTQAIKLIRQPEKVSTVYDYVRLGPPHPNIWCMTKFHADIGWWLQLSAMNGGFVFATRPFLATRSFYDKIGPFKEQCDAYECERDYADRVNTYANKAPRGMFLGMAEVVQSNLEGPWVHVGEVEVGRTYP